MAEIIDDLRRIEKLQAAPGKQIPPGMFEIQYATLHFAKPANEQPIGEFIQRIYLYEDMECTAVSGWIEIQDTWNLVRNGIILGQELLYLKFRTPESDFPVDFTQTPLLVYKIEDMQELRTSSGSPSQTGLTYKLHVISPEQVRSDRTRISETMQGSCSGLIKNILTKHIKTIKPMDIEKTEELRHIIMPNVRPFQAITNYLVRNAQAQTKQTSGFDGPATSNSVFKGNKVTDFYFYETTKGYKFKSTQQLFDPDMFFTIGTTPSNPGYLGLMTTSTQHSYLTPADTLFPVRQGTWAARHIRHSASTKSFNITESNYHRSLEKLKYAYVSETPVYATNGVTDTNIKGEPARISDFPESRIMFDSSASRKTTNINKTNGNITFPWSIPSPNIALQRLMQTEHLMNYQLLNVRLHGISGLEAGMVLYLNLPDIGEGSGYLGGGDAWEDRLSNLWVIKSLAHTIVTKGNEPAYWCDLTLSNLSRFTLIPLPIHDGTGSNKFWRGAHTRASE